MNRNIFYFRGYYLEFFTAQTAEVQRKFNYTLQLIATIDMVPENYFKHISGTKGIYEISVEVQSNIYRVFSFFDEGNLIILVNGFQKKTLKTPRKEIELALRLRKEYYEEFKK
ncbi:type II toxin-antitoxin system RelE/ParE family toxin [Flavobacterium aurantiibacter]|uniref:Addiction module toxin RelE n=1 Tax=Flavobacterium aurantiibacter TaxID=2023067 RepID=A0A255ZDC5_9FLAO|nr:type II toxin-antitoxin system RelE/ParE family toxin [Flavobacterium aurantiibacter]OYQ39553.1 addiction module toxin RelE [Flavobacterium aurantiibacter]